MKKTFFSYIWEKMREHSSLILSILLTLLLAGSIWSIENIEIVKQFTSLNTVFIVIGIGIMNIVFVTLSSVIKKIEYTDRFLLVGTFGIIIFFSILYYLRLSQSSFGIGIIELQSRWIIGPILLLYLVCGYYMLDKSPLPFFLRAGLAFLILLSTFSFFSFVNENRFTSTFSSDIFTLLIGEFSPVPWILLASVSLAFISRVDLESGQFTRDTPIIIILSFLNSMVILSIYWLSISFFGIDNFYYWQQAFFGFIIWDLLFHTMTLLYDHGVTDLGFRIFWKRLTYYLILLLIIVFSQQILNMLL